MKYLPLTAAGAILLAGSMAVYAQTEKRPPEPDASMSQGQQGGGGQSSGQEKRPQEQGGTERRSGGDKAQTGEQQGGSDANRNAQDKDRDVTKGAQGGNDDRKSNQAEQGGGSDEKRNRAESEKKSGGSQDNNQRAQQSGGDGGKSKAKPREASSKIQPQQKTIIKQRIVERQVRPVQVNFSVSVGSLVPRTVVLYDLPVEIVEIAPAYRGYKYVLADDDTILVIDPETWEIVDVIEI